MFAYVGSIQNLKDLKDLRKGEVLAYVGRIHNLKDLKGRVLLGRPGNLFVVYLYHTMEVWGIGGDDVGFIQSTRAEGPLGASGELIRSLSRIAEWKFGVRAATMWVSCEAPKHRSSEAPKKCKTGKQKCLLGTPFYRRACRLAMLGSIKT